MLPGRREETTGFLNTLAFVPFTERKDKKNRGRPAGSVPLYRHVCSASICVSNNASNSANINGSRPDGASFPFNSNTSEAACPPLPVLSTPDTLLAHRSRSAHLRWKGKRPRSPGRTTQRGGAALRQASAPQGRRWVCGVGGEEGGGIQQLEASAVSLPGTRTPHKLPASSVGKHSKLDAGLRHRDRTPYQAFWLSCLSDPAVEAGGRKHL